MLWLDITWRDLTNQRAFFQGRLVTILEISMTLALLEQVSIPRSWNRGANARATEPAFPGTKDFDLPTLGSFKLVRVEFKSLCASFIRFGLEQNRLKHIILILKISFLGILPSLVIKWVATWANFILVCATG